MLDVYQFHGVVFHEASATKKEQVGDCPFCGATKHFYVNSTTGLGNCKKCDTSVNPVSFITKLHEMYLATTTDAHYESLAELRDGIHPHTLKQAQFAWDGNTNRWLVPYPGKKQYLTNLGAFRPNVGFRIFKTPGMELSLYTPFQENQDSDHTIVLEGEWDLLAAYPIIYEHSDWFPQAAPGALTFKDEFIPAFNGKHVVLAYDNDDAGKKGIFKVTNALNHTAKTIKFLKWPEDHDIVEAGGTGPGKDIRDLVVHKFNQVAESTAKRKPNPSHLVWSYIKDNLDTPTADANSENPHLQAKFSLPQIEKVESWNHLISVFRKNLYLTPSNEACIAVCLATAISPYFAGEPLWIFLIGPPSSGKTTLIEAFGTSNMYCEAQSQISAKMLVNGWRLANGKDTSALPTLNKRTLLIKDYTTVLSMSNAEQEELYGILRDAFDGTFRKKYGNAEERNYDELKFGFIAGVTKAVYGDNRSSLGERFLKIEYLDKEEFDEIQHIKAGMSGNKNREERARTLQQHMLGYLDHLINNLPPSDELPDPPEHFEHKITLLALLVARLRAQVERRGDDSLLYRPEWEVATRLSVQLKKMSQLLMIVFNKDLSNPEDWDNLVYSAIQKLALNSCIPFNVEFAKRMHGYPEGITRERLAYHLQIPPTNVHRILIDLQQLGIVHMTKINKSTRGRPQEAYALAPEIYQLWEDAIERDLYGTPIPLQKVQDRVELPKRVHKKMLRQQIG